MRVEPSMGAHNDSRISGDTRGQDNLFDEPDAPLADDQLLSDYRQRYGLAEDPFAQDYSFPLFTGAGRRHLLDQLLHLCQFSNSLLVVLGEFGVGKTRTAHAFMDSLSEQDQICFLTLRPGQSVEQTLTAIAQTFGINAGPLPSAENLLAGIEAFIAEEVLVEEAGLALVVIDNAQHLDDQTLAVLSALLGNFPQQNRLHLALFGEPSVMARLDRLSPEGLLINDFYLAPFTLAEATDYLNFRMEMADYLGPEIFTEAMVDPWWRQAQGQLSILHECAQERLLDSVTPKQIFQKRALPVAHILAISVIIALVGVLFLYMGEDEPAADISVVSVPASGAPTTENRLELTSTSTPVQPLLQSLPQPQQPNQIRPAPEQPVQQLAGAANNQSASDFERQEVVPLAQLPTSSVKKAPEPVVEPAPQPAVPVANSAVVQPEPQSRPQPEPAARVPAPPKNTLATTASPQERNILAWPASEYTVQLLGVSNRKAALDYIAAQPNKSELLLFKSKRQGKDWFVVITGRFSSSAEARQAIARLPAGQRDAGPWPRDVKTIQTEIKSAL